MDVEPLVYYWATCVRSALTGFRTVGECHSCYRRVGPWIAVADEAPSHALRSDMFVEQQYAGPG